MDRVDETSGALLRAARDAKVEPDRAVEGGVLDHQQVAQLLGPVLGVLVGGKVAALATPLQQRVDDPIDDLADAGLAIRAPRAAPEVLLGDDVDGQLGPRAGDLDVLLLEDRLPLLAGDGRRPALPLHQVEGVAAYGCEVALEAEPNLGMLMITVLTSSNNNISCVFGHF